MDEAAKTKLEALLQQELAASQTYQELAERWKDTPHIDAIRQNQASHQRRVEALQARVAETGGWAEPETRPWPGIDGDTGAVLTVLEENEDQLLREYRNRPGMADLDAASLRILGDTLIPEQDKSHRAIADLKAAV